ncbi:L-asparaginase/GlutRNAGln amidotransferase subunit D [Sanguibacter keddieii DSM 10542]|uniref:L-asparaginase/GlutRNAGln amidotransferase subunit D n=1 Tax=Sanguibacter keddieii (strain ATCC 51767 / DSM 10542 / NCFB 3025 / ST-74) TaxID=446469 RepID=D1BG85_SANKS|nr:asparaginase [Sanguibacter keddieii]ACZ23602.1 L-asparaginase/GlutRNAGln amidotransferase subunit D [Sanguibacter keddieii DSM 10542]
MTQRRISLITLGGTISSEATRATSGVVPVSGADLFRQEVEHWVPGIALLPHELRLVPSPSLTLDDLLALHRYVLALPDDVEGVVVSQGTDTIEETAFALDLLGTASARPVVVTGAMRSRAAAGEDGPANLVSAVLVAASAEARRAGVLVQFADLVHSARWVSKRSTFHVDAFTSEPLGPLGYVAEGEARLELRPRPRPVLTAPESARARVALVSTGAGDDLALLPGLADAGYDGVVLAGVGAGHVAASAVENVAATAARIPVLMASRTGAGPVFERTYGYPGGEIDLRDRGVMTAGQLSPVKARVLLALLLSSGTEGDGLREAVARHS